VTRLSIPSVPWDVLADLYHRRMEISRLAVGLLDDTLCQGTANGRRETLDPLARDRLRDEKRF
jgi:hypothetical protein